MAEKDQLAEAMALLGTAIAKQTEIAAQNQEALVALHKSQPPRDVQYGDPDYQASLKKDRREWKSPTYQNGFDPDPTGLTLETIDRVANLKAGHYLKGLIEVQVSAKGAVNFKYKNKTPDQRFALQVQFRDFTDMV